MPRNTPPASPVPAMKKKDGTPVSEELTAWFTALAQTHGWTCALCGQAIQVDSRFIYFSTGRCIRCEGLVEEPQK
jgi:hypothetical protein